MAQTLALIDAINLKKDTMKKVLLLSVLFITFSNVFSQNLNTAVKILDYVDSLGMNFRPPVLYRVLVTKENSDLQYSFALMNRDSSMEIRYSIWPLKPYIEEYEKPLNDPNSLIIDPNNLYKGIIQSNVLNMTSGKYYDIGHFDSKAVKKEFNADAGGSCFFDFDCEFGEGYKYGQFVYLHKDNVADVIITYMSNDKERHSELMMDVFHALTFK